MSTVGRQLGSRGGETVRGWFLRSGTVRFALSVEWYRKGDESLFSPNIL